MFEPCLEVAYDVLVIKAAEVLDLTENTPVLILVARQFNQFDSINVPV